jgi:hypothetical protein
MQASEALYGRWFSRQSTVTTDFQTNPAYPDQHGDHPGEATMNATNPAVASALLVLAIGSSAQAQQAVQWRVEDGGNGHWYAITPTSTTFWALESYCRSKGGHLAAFATRDELLWVGSALPVRRCFVGGYQDLTEQGVEEPNGGWKWTTGEPFDLLEVAPNGFDNGGGGHNFTWFDDCDCTTYLDDAPDMSTTGVIEWSADCNGDGIVDYGQILSGQLMDANGNGVPDSCEPPPGENLIPDGGFELGISNWTLSNTDFAGGWRVAGGNPGGTVILNSNGLVATDPTISTTVSGLVVGERYRLRVDFASVYLLGTNQPSDSFEIFLNGTKVFGAAVSGDREWRHADVAFVAGATTATVMFVAEANGTDNDYKIDNASIVPYPPPPPCLADINGSNDVDGVDLAAVLGAWGTSGEGFYDTDITNDGIVDGEDLAYVLSGWGPCP